MTNVHMDIMTYRPTRPRGPSWWLLSNTNMNYGWILNMGNLWGLPGFFWGEDTETHTHTHTHTHKTNTITWPGHEAGPSENTVWGTIGWHFKRRTYVFFLITKVLFIIIINNNIMEEVYLIILLICLLIFRSARIRVKKASTVFLGERRRNISKLVVWFFSNLQTCVARKCVISLLV